MPIPVQPHPRKKRNRNHQRKEKTTMNKNLKVLVNGIIKENPIFVLLLGMCPTLATTSSAINGMSMGLATMFVLICSNAVISLLKNVIPDMVRIRSEEHTSELQSRPH